MATMSPGEVLRAWFTRVWNQGEEAAIYELFSPNGIGHGLPGGPITGHESFRSFLRSFKSAFPDFTITITQSVTEGDRCAVFCEVTGTNSGTGLGFEATHRQVRFTGALIARVENGRIEEAWNSFDFLSFYQQLGLLPPVQSTLQAGA